VPETETMVEELKREIATIAEELQIAPQVIASRAMLKAVAVKKPETVKEITHCGGILNWQARLLHEPVKRVIHSLE
jgi:ribonuclease D